MQSMTKKEIKEALKNDEIILTDDYELHEKYDEMLDEVYGDAKVAGMNMQTSRVLKEMDPIAYRTGFNDWTDSLDELIEGEDGNYYFKT